VGLVLNEVHRDLSDSYHYYDYYRSYYRTPNSEKLEDNATNGVPT
jgi:hypothetical protein